MFEQEIQYYLARGAALVEGRDAIRLADISASTLLPAQIKTFFRAEALTLLRETMAASVGAQFDLAQPDARALLARLETVLTPTALFGHDEYMEILERSVKLTFNYLCRPQLTLRSFVFRGATSVSITDALVRIGHFHDYPYFRTVLHPWLERKRAANETHVAIEAFGKALAKIDEQMMQGMTVQDLHAMMQPMFRWIADAQTPVADRIATDAYVVFFDDKNIGRIAEHLAALAAQSPLLSTQQVCIVIEQMIADIEGDPATLPAEAEALRADAYGYGDGEDEDDDIEEEYDQQSTLSVVPDVDLENSAIAGEELLIAGDVDATQDTASPTGEEPVNLVDEVWPALPEEFSEPEFSPAVAAAEEVEPMEQPVPTEAPAVDDVAPRGEEPTFDSEAIDDAAHVHEPSVEAAAAPAADLPAAQDQSTRTVSEPAPAPASVPPPVPMAQRNQTLGAVMTRAHYSDRSSEFKIVGARPTPAAALTDLRSSIDDDARKKFIKKLFRRNDPEYERALDALNALHTWKEASAYIDSLFLRYGIDPYAKVAIQFTDVVYSRFVKVPSTERS